MYIQGEYNNDWEWVGDEESVLEIFQIFRIFRIFHDFRTATKRMGQEFPE